MASFNSLKELIKGAALIGTPDEAAPATSATPAHRPPDWDAYVGQPRAKRRLKMAINSALARDQRAEHIMLTSPPGSGKTTLADLIAREMARPLVLLTKPPTAQEFQRACEKAEYGVLFVDEIHNWSPKLQEMLMELTESGTLDTPYGPQRFPFITVVAATTDTGPLLLALLDRFMVKIELDPYSDEEMTEIALGMVDRCWVEGHEPLSYDDCAELAVAAAGVPRNLRALIFAGRDLIYSGEEPTPDAILELCDTDPDGLTRAHHNLLAQLAKSNNGTAGEATLSSQLRIPIAVLRRTEKLLVDRNYVALTGSGRVITPAGRARLKGSIRDAA